ncbi:MAG: GTP 3',8-cyclase MoaA [Deltaproteobacteria bacterium]|nr:GTP 3',8-cyclase MoaA [Deltaproteobacteria bacterium]
MTQADNQLIDPDGRNIHYLRVSVTDRCNYRCTYCMPEDGVDHTARADVLSFEEITALVSAFAGLGVRRVRLTGGEPTVRKDLVTLAGMLAALPGIEDLALSTNGHRLAELAAPLRAAGVTRLNVSLDSLRPERFAKITRRGQVADVLAGLAAAKAVGFASIKLNAVAIKGFNDDEVAALCTFAWQHGFVPRFIEQMPMMEGALFVPGQLMSAADVRAALLADFPGAALVPEPEARLGAGPARYWRLEGGNHDGICRLGLITPITEHFCDTCNRVRLSSSGSLHTCLAHDNAVDLRRALHDGGSAAVQAAILAALALKPPSHLFTLGAKGGPRKSMVQIGG